MVASTTRGDRIAKENLKETEERAARALGHEHRVRIMDILNEGDAAATDIARKIGINQNLLPYTVSILRECCFVEFVGSPTPSGRGAPKKMLRSLAPTLFHDLA